MPVWGRMIVHLTERPGAEVLDRWRRDLLGAFCPDHFTEQPLAVIESHDMDLVPFDDGGTWIDLGSSLTYYGEGYERGDPQRFVLIAEWIDSQIPGSQVYYGHDNSDEEIGPFGLAERLVLLEYHARVGHEPFDNRHRGRIERERLIDRDTDPAIVLRPILRLPRPGVIIEIDPEVGDGRGKAGQHDAFQRSRLLAGAFEPDIPISHEEVHLPGGKVDHPVFQDAVSQVVLSFRLTITPTGLRGDDLSDEGGITSPSTVSRRPPEDDPKVGAEPRDRRR